MKEEHVLRNAAKKDGGNRIGIVCITYRNRGRIVILISNALPNQETFKEFHLFRSSCVSIRMDRKLSLKRSFKFVGISIPIYIIFCLAHAKGNFFLQSSTEFGGSVMFRTLNFE